jgi:hypothetical protein
MPSPNPAGRRGKEQDGNARPVSPDWKSQAGILRRIKRDHPALAGLEVVRGSPKKCSIG